MDHDVLEYYERGEERDRLATGGWLEFARTKEVLERFLPPPPARVLDVGGGPGAYAAWLAARGYDVHLVDPVPLHVEQARAAAAGTFTVAAGDARRLDEGDASCAAVLLLGPLYHLPERAERLTALREARRAVAPGGIVAAAAISRFASLFDGFARRLFLDREFLPIVERDLRDGQHRNASDRPHAFTTAFFHHPHELAAEVADAGLSLRALVGVEGPGGWFAEADDPPELRERLVSAARAVEAEPTLLGASAHLLAIAQRVD
ncbi:MAG TPA: methyltransferase domain-containing protein [Gaiellaceae bacterium]|nr:methyltransferase domain-containing protein [Gaiellaceae bacterium]